MSVAALPYDAWLHWVVTVKCVMDCEYCRTCDGDNAARRAAPLEAIDIPRLMNTLEKTGRTFRISFTGGGEPFLVPNLLEACLELTKKHYISFNTNLAEKKVRPFLEEIDPSRVLIIDASCHIKALEQRRLVDRYVENFVLARDRGIPIRASQVAFPPLLPEVEKYRQFFQEHDIYLGFGPFIGEYQGKEYPKAYTDEELEIFGFSRDSVVIHYPNDRRDIPFCNAGYNVGIVRADGVIHTCDDIRTPIGNIYEGVDFGKSVIVCPVAKCGCPLFNIDPLLFEKAKQENPWFVRREIWKKKIATAFKSSGSRSAELARDVESTSP